MLNPAYLESLYATVNASPFPRHLPFRLVEITADGARVELDVAEAHLQPFDIVHGGVIATLIDTATFWAGFARIPEDAGLVNIDLKLTYLETARRGRLVATGRCVRSGRTLSYAEAHVVGPDNTLIAHGTSSLMTLPGKGLTIGVPKFL
jgi:uncharacterized protein (TIGR00369 family)